MTKLVCLFIAAILPFTASAEDEPKKLGLSHESSLGYVVTGGNSSAETFNLAQETLYVWDAELLKWTGNYLAASSKDPSTDVEAQTAENWATALRYERSVSDRLGFYGQTGIAGDRFQGLRERKTLGLGLKYVTVKTETFTWVAELGYEYARELFESNKTIIGPNPTDIQVQTGHPEYHFARAFTQADYAHSKTLSFGAYVEYLHPFADQLISEVGNDADDYRVNFSPYMVSVLSDMFSLKVAYIGRYRNVPIVQGNEQLDFTFSTTLLATY